MFCTLTAITALFGLVCATGVAANPQACNQDACLKRVIADHKPEGYGGCKAFFRTTILPLSTTTVTTTLVATSFATEIESVTLQTTTTTSTTTTSFSTEVDTGVSTVSIPPSSTGQQQQKLLKRSPTTTSIYSSTKVPSYAAKVCTDTAIYSSACSCVGATHRTTTLPLRVKTKTITKHHKTIETISQTSTVETSVTTTTSATTSTSLTTTTTFSATVTAQCTEVSAPNGNGVYLVYSNYYSGKGYEETPNNPGNNDVPRAPQTVDFTDIGENDACDAIQRCANVTAPAYFDGFSFDIHYLSSSAEWECVGYYEGNSDPSYFNVPNSDITQAYGFSYVRATQ